MPQLHPALEQIHWKPLMIAVLKAIGTGAVILSVIAAPQMASAFAYFGILDDPRQKRKLYRKLRALEHHGYIKRYGNRYSLSSKGRRLLAEDEVWDVAKSEKKNIAPFVHVCMFDIPIKKNKARHSLRAILNDLEYEKLQNSVFVCGYDHQEFLERFAKYYGIAPYVRFFKAKELSK